MFARVQTFLTLSLKKRPADVTISFSLIGCTLRPIGPAEQLRLLIDPTDLTTTCLYGDASTAKFYPLALESCIHTVSTSRPTTSTSAFLCNTPNNNIQISAVPCFLHFV